MGGQCIGLLSIEAGNLYLAEMLTSFFDAASSRRYQAVAILGRTWKSPVDNESLFNQVYHFVPFLGLRGQVVASALLSTYQPLNELPEQAGLSDSNTVYLGGALRPGQFSVELEASIAIRAAVRHLVIDHGCARVACVTGPAHNPESILRLRAYRMVVRELGLPWSSEWEECGEFSADGGQNAIRILQERLPGIEGVLFLNDAMALGAMQYFETARIPGHRRPRFIAFDDIEELHFLDIPLSTIAQPLDRMMDECVRRLAGDDVPSHCDVPANLVIRRSCGCEGGGERAGSRSAFREGLDLLFTLQKVRLATQCLFQNLEPSGWDTRLGMALKRLELPWLGILEWQGPGIPDDWSQVTFSRWAEYEDGILHADRCRNNVAPQILAEKLQELQGAAILMPLVCADQFLGLALFRHVAGMEQVYDALVPSIGAAMLASRGRKD